MAKPDETVTLLKEIRDLLREQSSLAKAQHAIAEREKQTKLIGRTLHVILNASIVIFVIGASYYFYHSIAELV